MDIKQAVKKVWNVTYIIDKETPGTMRYQQVDERGVPVSNIMPSCVAPTIYIRKSAFKGSQPPTRLTVTISGE